MYGSDYDDHFPYGVSNANKEISYLKHRDDKDKILEMAPINSVLHPYIKNDALWKCPSDFGGDHIFLTSIDKKNNFYDSFNVSYFYDFRFALKNKHFSSVTAWLGGCPYPEINESKIILFCDQSLLWHSSNTGKEWDIGLEFVLNFRVNGISIGGNLLKDIKSDRYFTPHWLLFNEEDRFSVPC